MNIKIKELIDLIISWARERNILIQGTGLGQAIKTKEEVDELITAIDKQDFIGIKDGIGDVMVTLVIIAKMYDLNLSDCLQHAYNEIKDRKGKMIDGKFVKEE